VVAGLHAHGVPARSHGSIHNEFKAKRWAAGATMKRAVAQRVLAVSCVALGVACGGVQKEQTPTPRAADATLPFTQKADVLIRGATVWTATGKVLVDTDVLLSRGKIRAVARGIKAPTGATVIAARGRIVTPGLVDMHSHLGVYPAPYAKAHEDGNEMTGPITPMVRAIDAFDPEDIAIPRALRGGVTTSLILPGSGNIMGGEALYVKLRGKTVGEMAIRNPPRALKMAMGENPKRIHGRKGRQPMSRMGHAWLMRKHLHKARELRNKQKRWQTTGRFEGTPRPNDPALEPLVALLEGKVRLQVHCYEVHDIETLIRVSEEFGFKIAAIHHALEAWKVPKLLKDHGIAVATFSDLWGFKMEAWDASVHGPHLLAKAGVAVAIKTDHPVLDARNLAWEAAKAHHYGLDERAAIAAVTRIPAAAIGLGERLGSIEVGKDADVLLWAKHPFEIGARPARVWVEGVQWWPR
jgi:imidazolonepropionase-like amidohydrolase